MRYEQFRFSVQWLLKTLCILQKFLLFFIEIRITSGRNHIVIHMSPDFE